VSYLKRFDMGAGGTVQAALGEASRTVIGQARPNVRWRFREAGTLQLSHQTSRRQESLTKLRYTQQWAQPPGRYAAVLTTARGRRYAGEIQIPTTGMVDVQLDADGSMRGKGGQQNVLRPVAYAPKTGVELRAAVAYQRLVTDPVAGGAFGVSGDLRFWPERIVDWVDVSVGFSAAQDEGLTHRELTVAGAAGWRFGIGPLALDLGAVGLASLVHQEGWPAATLAVAPGGGVRAGLAVPGVRWLPVSLSVDVGARGFRTDDAQQRVGTHVMTTFGVWFF
jgi:hypothetical protein